LAAALRAGSKNAKLALGCGREIACFCICNKFFTPTVKSITLNKALLG
jgi:hypothetical protein